MRETECFRDVPCDSPNGIPCSMSMMDEIDGSVLMKDNIIEDPLTSASMDSGNPSKDAVQNDDHFSVEGKPKHACETLVRAQGLQVTSGLEGGSPDIGNNSGPRLRARRSRLFSAKELSSSIIASESTRIICSVLIALLVVLSYVDYPLLGINIVNSKSIIAAKPLYLLLVTEITVLIAHLVLERRRRFEDFEEEIKVLKEDRLNWDRAVRMLERGLVAHQTVRAIFIDCSVYVVIVICGLCLV